MPKKLNGIVYRTLVASEAKTVRGKQTEVRSAVARAEREDGKRKEFSVKVDERGDDHAMKEAIRQAEEWIGWVDV